MKTMATDTRPQARGGGAADSGEGSPQDRAPAGRGAATAPLRETTRRTALITGASQGIGEAIARRLAADGARVVLAARNQEKLSALAGEIAESGGEALAFTLDVAEPEAAAVRLGELPEEWSGVDVLVNNAGITADNLFARMTLDEWQRVLTTNLTGAFAVTRSLVRGMIRRRWGRVISVSSVVGLMGNAGQANYAASKAGLVGFTKSLARELGSRNITVNVVAPGYIDTTMTGRLPEDVRKELTASIPLRRIGRSTEVAAAVAFLASDEAGYITGTTLNVSGGLYI
jgi:3-oxoacyl-[acyl-carrier protein] reductase